MRKSPAGRRPKSSRDATLPALQEGLRTRQLKGLAGSMEISPKQLHVIVALLEGSTTTAAARAAGVDRKTVYRWAKEPAFVAAYNQLRHELSSAVRNSLRAMAGDALEALRSIVNDVEVPAASRLQAINRILDAATEPVTGPKTIEAADSKLMLSRVAIGGIDLM